MALVDCSDCSDCSDCFLKVSTNAKSCSHCGNTKVPRKDFDTIPEIVEYLTHLDTSNIKKIRNDLLSEYF